MDLIQIILITVSIITIILTIVLFVVSKNNTESKIKTIQEEINSKIERDDVKSEVIAVLSDKENPIQDPQFVNMTLHNGRIYWDGLSYNVDKDGKKYVANRIDSKNMPYITLSAHDELRGSEITQCEKGGCFYVVRKDGGKFNLMNHDGNNAGYGPDKYMENDEFIYTASGDTAPFSIKRAPEEKK